MPPGDNGAISHRELEDVARVAHDARERVGTVEYALRDLRDRVDKLTDQWARQQIIIPSWSLWAAGALAALGYIVLNLFSSGRVP